ncbi:MAG: hypothetical protein NTW03_05180 [Verrucomicrobia bacterium]|nr:hypothetical protein [Verrucomicrobiota bacterium]
MRIRTSQIGSRPVAGLAFTIVEVCFSMAMAAIMFIALYAGLESGFAMMRLARENTRATQIMIEKMETIRLYTWDQINSNGFIPNNFSVAYYPMGGSNCGVIYNGVLTITNVPFNTSYAGNMRKVIVTLNWQTGSTPRSRTLSTYVARYGLQNYIWNQ